MEKALVDFGVVLLAILAGAGSCVLYLRWLGIADQLGEDLFRIVNGLPLRRL